MRNKNIIDYYDGRRILKMFTVYKNKLKGHRLLWDFVEYVQNHPKYKIDGDIEECLTKTLGERL